MTNFQVNKVCMCINDFCIKMNVIALKLISIDPCVIRWVNLENRFLAFGFVCESNAEMIFL